MSFSIDFYRPQRSCDKAMFSQASVILFTVGGVWQTPTGRRPLPQVDTPPPLADNPLFHSHDVYCLSFTSGVTPADLLTTSMLAGHFCPHDVCAGVRCRIGSEHFLHSRPMH